MKWKWHAGAALAEGTALAGKRLAALGQRGMQAMRCAGMLLGGWLLGRVALFGGCAPLGLGFLGACGGGLGGACAAVGVMLGAVAAGGPEHALRYGAAALLIYSAAFIFRSMPLSRRRWFPPLNAAVMTACIGLVYLRFAQYELRQAVLLAAEVLLAGGSCVVYGALLQPTGRKGREQAAIGLAALGMSLSLALGNWQIAGIISPGRCLAAFSVLTAAYAGGAAVGCLTGLSLGMALDAAAGTPGVCALALGFSGAFGGLYRRRGRLPTAVCCVVANGLAAFWCAQPALRTSLLYEFFIASVLFMLPTDRFYENLRSREAATGRGAAGELRYLLGRASLAAAAYSELAALLERTRETGRNDEDVMSVFDVAAERVCRACDRRDGCWGVGYEETRAALVEAAAAMEQRGRAEVTDFPQRFRDRCLDVRGYTETVSRELQALYRRRQMKRRLHADRELLYCQYREFADTLRALASGGVPRGREERKLELRLDEFLRDYAPGTVSGVFRDLNDRLHIDIQGVGLAAMAAKPDWLARLSEAAATPLSCPQHAGGGEVNGSLEELAEDGVLHLYETEPLAAEVRIAAIGREGRELSGDAARSFKTAEGVLYLLLADGMGSGKAAAADSGAAAALMEKLLRAGVDPEAVMRILNTAMLLRSEKSLTSAGVDLMSVNLFTGETLVYKYGAAPSYIRVDGQVRAVRGQGPAAGVRLRQPDCTRLRLGAGSAAVILSDGVPAADSVAERLRTAGSGLKELAGAILADAAAAAGGEDDMTVLTLSLEKHGEPSIS